MAVTNRDALVKLFTHLGYDTDKRQAQTADALGISQSGLKTALKHVERISANDELQVFLFEVASVTLAHRRAITTLLNNRDGEFVFVLTDPDYERLDFVLIERFQKEATGPGGQSVRARPLAVTVERRKPVREALRTLRRMSFTCSDDLGQLEKLLSAFRIAQWSEPRFNNVALFSDRYLTHRLQDEPEWQDVDGAKAAFKTIRDLGDQNKSTQAKSIEEVVLPVLDALGHKPIAAKAADGGPMLRLSDSVVCFPYHWMRALDTKDDNDPDRPEDVPAVRVVSEFEQGKAEWAILTNGKVWRLYCARAHGRHANFYEVDFRETLATQEADGETFRYFWLMLRAQAFELGAATDGKPGPCFLDRIFDGSREYAKELGERLKGRVFEQIFPHLAEGFVTHIRNTEKDPEFSEERLHEIFRATLTLLYRLIFLLYAESLDLLPVTEANYQEVSLRKLCKELAERAGMNEAQAIEKLEKAFSPSETGLYDRLTRLFRVVDGGDNTVNVPKYNGGLFITEPDLDDHSDEANAARFLTKYKVPDRFLASGLDRLARDEDPKRHELVPVDYKSLGVRQLGSIYEGLLEFKVQVAAERMAVVKAKKGEAILPAKQAEKEKLKVSTRVKMHGADGGYLKKGTVYLANDKQERKATGSYYTPDYIVKYIVEHTVGPVLEERFNELRDDFRKAEVVYRAAQKKDAKLKERGLSDDPEKVANEYRWLVDRLFTLRVLDPAMGSGHFLVEAVDFITDRMLAFLNGFGWNPVQAFIQRTRRDILNSLQKAGVDIDEKKLTDINLLKRHVLKRCIFGVDLNPMAVELAKVSLWLDCFTLGAPLSFLDHHLKCGNSLIGVTVEEVEKTLKKSAGMFSSRFAGLMLATDKMLEVARLADSTAEQAAQSRSEFKRAQDALAPFKRILDIYTSQWFGNGPVTSPGRKAGGTGKARKSKEGPVAAIEWLNSDAVEELLAANAEGFIEVTGRPFTAKPQLTVFEKSDTTVLKDKKKRKPSITDKVDNKADAWFNNVPKLASKASAEHRFFHWELEFPEVFYAPTTPGGQNVKRMEGAGFDAVVGNPPYDVMSVKEVGSEIEQVLSFAESREHFAPAMAGKRNLFKLFLCLVQTLPRRKARLGMIVPMAILADDHSRGVRRVLITVGGLFRVDAFPQKDDAANRVFEEAKTAVAILIAAPGAQNQAIQVNSHPGRLLKETSGNIAVAHQAIYKLDPESLPIPACNEDDWRLVGDILSLATVRRMGDYARGFQGEINETTDRNAGLLAYEDTAGPEVIRGAHVTMYAIREASQGTPFYVRERQFERARGKSERFQHHLVKRVAWQEASPQNNFRRIIAASVPAGRYCGYTVNYIPETTCSLPLPLVLALLNSSILDWFFRVISSHAHVTQRIVALLPVPELHCGQTDPQLDIRTLSSFDLNGFIAKHCKPGRLDEEACALLQSLVAAVERVEGSRRLASRSDRSELAEESSTLQLHIDRIIGGGFGLRGEDVAYIRDRLSSYK